MRRRAIDFGDAELAFIEALQELPRAVIHAEFVEQFQRADVTEDNIKGLCSRLGWSTRMAWSPEHDAIIKKRYANTLTSRIGRMVNRPTNAVYHRAAALGLRKSDAFMASPVACRLRRGDQVGKATRFKKGQAPLNKGVKYPAGWSPGRMGETQFTKGQDGWNWKPVGAERIVGGYWYSKVSDQRRVAWTVNWKATHTLRWESLHGPVPQGHALKSADGDRLNTDPKNWTLISRGVLPRLNGSAGRRVNYDEAPAELKPTIMVVAQLEHAVLKHRRRTREAVP